MVIASHSTQKRPHDTRPETRSQGVHSDGQISLEEIENVIVDTGYSADQRKGFLKEILAELTQRQSTAPTSETEQMIGKVKQAIDDQQAGRPIAKDLP